MIKKSEEDYVAYPGTVNKQCEQFNLSNLSADQFKCLMFICGSNASTDADIRTKLLSLLDTEKEISLDKVTSEAIRLTTLKHDTKMVEQEHRSSESSVQQITRQKFSSDKQQHNNKKPKSACWHCGEFHYARLCKYKQHKCTQCQTVGHKDGHCTRSTAQQLSSKQQSSSSSSATGKRHFQHKASKTNTVVLVSQINFESRRKFITITINGVAVKLKVDTASDITIISSTTWEMIGKPATTASKHSARNATGDIMNLSQQFTCDVTLGSITIAATCYISDVPNLNLLGIEWIEASGLWDIPVNSIFHKVISDSQIDNSKFVDNLQTQFADVFDSSLGLCTKMQATLHLRPNTKAIFRPKRPVPYAALPAVEAELDRLEQMQVISRVDFSSWAAPIVAVRKPNGVIRVCADFSTGLNDALQPQQYPLPLPEDIFATLAGGQYFSNIDLADAYLQISVDDLSKQLLTINTHRGLYQYNRLCFGVKSAPGILTPCLPDLLE